MKVTATSLDGVLILEPEVHGDDRGFIFESYNEARFQRATGLAPRFVQDNHSASRRGVVRGIHYQVVHPQAKLIRAVAGRILDVAVDLRRGSPTLGRHVAVELSAANRRQLWIPVGFGHGFTALSDEAELVYKTTAYWSPEHDRAIAWNDPALAIDWPVTGPILSARDRVAPRLAEAELL